MKSLRFFLDFDGTISRTDAVDVVLERFADPSWRAIEEEWAAGAIGSRECLQRQLSLVRAADWDLNLLLDGIGIDAHFEDFLRRTAEYEIPVCVVSDGFDLFIKRILESSVADKRLLERMPIFSNRARLQEGRLAVEFPQAACAHGCANCKPEVLRRELVSGETAVFVGDGLSDRFAAAASGQVFAKGKLLDHCLREGIAHRAYTDFSEVTAWLESCRAGKEVFETSS